MGEAARVVVEYLLTLPDIDGIEAWIDSRQCQIDRPRRRRTG
jgi:hypothetical protein